MVGPAAAPLLPLRVFGMIFPDMKILAETTARNSWSCASSQLMKGFMDGRECSCRRRHLSPKISGLSRLLSVSSILSLVLLVFPRPSKVSVRESTQTHMGAGTRALLGPRAPASRRRALRGAAQGGADVVSRFPLLAPEARCGALRTPGARRPPKAGARRGAGTATQVP